MCFFIRFVYFLSFLSLVTMIRSHVSRSFMARSHLPRICWSVIGTFWMTLSHLKTQTRWAVSDMRSLRSRVGALHRCECRWSWSLWF
jgi:hypothetical protein